MHPLLTLAALALCVPFTAVCARGAGETDVAPLGQLGQLTQVIMGPLDPGQVATNVAGASVVAGAAAQTNQLLWAYRAGAILGNRPRRQAIASLIGVAVGAVLAAPAYALLTRSYGLGGKAHPPPFATAWKALAEVMTRGSAALPPHAARASAIAFGVGLLLAALSRGRLARFLPSSIAIGIGFVSPSSFALPVALGGLFVLAAGRLWPAQTERYASAIGGGAIAGESVMGVVIAALVAAQVLTPH
jgi:uncharacterized oligopeptide transporter (OPT) family protein